LSTDSLTWTLKAHTPTSTGHWQPKVSIIADACLIALNGFLAFILRFAPETFTGWLRGERAEFPPDPSRGEYLGFLLLYGVVILLLFQSQDLYRPSRLRSALDETLVVFRAVFLATLLLTVFIYLSNTKIISRLVVGGSAALNVLTLSAWRVRRRRVIERRLAEGGGARNVLIVGAGKTGQALASYFDANRRLGYVVKGFLDENDQAGPRVLGRLEDLPRVAQTHFADEIFITVPSDRDAVRSVALEARRHRLDVKVVPDLYDGLAWGAPLEFLGGFPVMSLHRQPIPELGMAVKRLLDAVGAAGGLLLSSPLLMLIALAIKLDSTGPVVYKASRVGKRGRRFTCYKFRTMVSNADALKDSLRHLNERSGPTFKISADPRLTRLGRWLRKFSLDELPQLWNVLVGDMSLVGPRPHPTDDFDQYSLEHLRRLDVTPGITGLWQVTARRDPSFERNMALDLQYIENWSLWLDFQILLKTVPAVVAGYGQ
jgi:exopolysaccharide biosynthesis polyprenyl glycosylphosphotransferase